MKFVGNKQLQWLGHVKRMAEDRLPVKSLEWVPNGSKRRGRPKNTWMEGIMNLMKDRDCRMVTGRIEMDGGRESKLNIGHRKMLYTFQTC